ncbi:MAG: hypothetical protein LUI04_03755 [Porphyromonadaceae bacterium]|nr:hypothetical protein [Porphyromonadaceae bacterium]
MKIMKRVIFYILKLMSFVMRPLRHGWFMRVLQTAYQLQGVTFKGRALYIHPDAYIDNVGKVTLGANIVISIKAILLAHDYSSKVYKNHGGGVKKFFYLDIGDK